MDMRIWIAVSILVGVAITATVAPDGHQARVSHHPMASPISTATDDTTLRERVVDACWELVSEPERICPARYSDGVRSAVYRGPPVFHE